MKDDIIQLLEEKAKNNYLGGHITIADISAANMAYIYSSDDDYIINPNNIWISEKDIDFDTDTVIQNGSEVSKEEFFSLEEALVIHKNNHIRLYKFDTNQVY